MNAIRYCLSWACFWVGHVLSVVMNSHEWMGWLYTPYNRMMVLSSDIQGDGSGPWKDAQGILNEGK